jgi:hypothetical protein
MAFMFPITQTPIFSGHETFPLRQLWLRKAFDAVSGHSPSAPKSLFSDHEAIVRFGVGKNMVASIKHWAIATNFMEEHGAGFRPTEIADAVLGCDGLDPYCEHPATVWLIHWFLAGRGNRSTTWHWLFNHVSSQSFTREDILSGLSKFVLEHQHRATETTLRRDIECCIKSYVPNLGGDSAEDVAEPILGELGLIQQGGKGIFEFRRGPKHTLPDQLFVFALLDFWSRRAPNVSTMSFDTAAHDFGSPGRVFKLDENGVADRVLNIENTTHGALRWSDTAGMRQIIKVRDIQPLYLLKAAYA